MGPEASCQNLLLLCNYSTAVPLSHTWEYVTDAEVKAEVGTDS
jgi:hypothetical protein